MRYRTILPTLLTAILLMMAMQAQSGDVQSLRVRDGKRTFNVPAFMHDGAMYMSLNEFARFMSLRSYTNDEAEKIELRVNDSRLKFAADNPYVVVLLHQDNSISKVYQFPVEVIRTDAAYYVPVIPLLPLLSETWNRGLQLDATVPELTILEAGAPVAEVKLGEGAPALSSSAPAPPPQKQETVKDNTSTAAPAPAASATFTITHLTVDTRQNGTMIRLHSRKKLQDYTISEDAAGNLVLSVPDATVDIAELKQTPTDGEEVKSVIAEQLGRNSRIVVELGGKFSDRKVVQDVKSNDLLVTLYRKAEVAEIYRAEKEQKTQKSSDRSKWKIDCIVIDPGHGGKDPGAIGVGGIKEKNITLGIALKLGKLIERKMPDVKVVYTRKDDRFIPLDNRGQIANSEGGDLFISIHCNSTEKKPSSANGFEVYILRPGRTEEAIRIAEFENSVIKLEKDYEKRYAKLDDENFILINMAQSAYVKYSEHIAELLHKEVEDSNQLKSKGVKQAGFYVLVGASMPSVLIESGFLSNRNEEKLLSSQYGQQHIANMFYSAVEKYVEEYEKSLGK